MVSACLEQLHLGLTGSVTTSGSVWEETGVTGIFTSQIIGFANLKPALMIRAHSQVF